MVIFGLFFILFKTSFFLVLVLLEVSLLLVAILLLRNGLSPWFVLPLIGIGACESSLGLSIAVWLSRSYCIDRFSI